MSKNRLKNSANNESKKARTKPSSIRSKKKSYKTAKLVFFCVVMFIALYCVLSIISFTRNVVISKNIPIDIDKGWFKYLLHGNGKNFMGNLGDILANLIVVKWFGLGFLLFILALLHVCFFHIFNRKIIKRKYLLTINLFLTLWFSLLFALILTRDPYVSLFSGFIGRYLMTEFIKPSVGTVGIAVILLVVALIFVGFRYGFNILSLLRKSNDEHEAKPHSTLNTPETSTDLNTDITYEEQDSVKNDYVNELVEEDIDDEEITVLQPNEIFVERPKEEQFSEEDRLEKLIAELGELDPRDELPRYKMPSLDLLEEYDVGNVAITNDEIEKNSQNIKNTLLTYSIEIKSIKATVGPTVTLYEIVPAPGVRISKIKNLEDDIALSLAALGIRIIAPIPGKGTIGIEVPNSKPQIVSMRSVLSSKKFVESNFELPIALGKTISNESYVADLTKMPHLLVAGATGQGKSVGLNAIISSLLYKKHPAQLKFVLIDPKKVELSLFSKIENHYLAKLPDLDSPIITDTKHVVNTLNSLLIEMESRYDLLKLSGVRNLKEYNVKYLQRRLNPEDGHRFLPYIVVIVDEFADLIMTAGKEVEVPLTRLAQLARAIGIHLVIATQRPSVNIITGTIKANFPARLAFRVVQRIDSRTILDTGGADQLIGRGDMLLSTGSDVLRMQCAFIDTDEIKRLTEFIGSQAGYATAFLLPEYAGENAESSVVVDSGDRDPLFAEAARLIVDSQHGSTSLIQRKMNLGYNRAGRIMDQLEATGIVGPAEGSKTREVYVHDRIELEKILG